MLLLYAFFGPCHLTFPHKDILSFFGHCHCHVKFQFQEILPFCGKFVQKALIICLSDSFAHKTTHQSYGSCNATSDSQFLCNFFKKQSLHFCIYIQKVCCEQRVLHCPPRCRNVIFSQVQISHLATAG